MTIRPPVATSTISPIWILRSSPRGVSHWSPTFHPGASASERKAENNNNNDKVKKKARRAPGASREGRPEDEAALEAADCCCRPTIDCVSSTTCFVGEHGSPLPPPFDACLCQVLS